MISKASRSAATMFLCAACWSYGIMLMAQTPDPVTHRLPENTPVKLRTEKERGVLPPKLKKEDPRKTNPRIFKRLTPAEQKQRQLDDAKWADEHHKGLHTGKDGKLLPADQDQTHPDAQKAAADNLKEHLTNEQTKQVTQQAGPAKQ